VPVHCQASGGSSPPFAEFHRQGSLYPEDARCGGSVKVIACIEDQDIIDRILAHLRKKEQDIPALPLLAPLSRARPENLPLFAWKGAR